MFDLFRLITAFGRAKMQHRTFVRKAKVYQTVGPELMENVFCGFNATFFADGQTGSGKTYTMLGDVSTENTRGVVPRLLEDLFQRATALEAEGAGNPNAKTRTPCKIECSFLEIYNEKCRDLLGSSLTQQSLRVRQHPKEGPFVESLSSHIVTSTSEALALLNRDTDARTVAATNMNDHSSRSRAMFSLTVTQIIAVFGGGKMTTKKRRTKVHLVDLNAMK